MPSDRPVTRDPHARIAQLRLLFLKRTVDELSQLQHLTARAEGGEMQSLRDIEQLAHKIAGTSMTFGFESISQRARALEQLLERTEDDTVRPGAPELQRCVASLSEEVRLVAGQNGLGPAD